MASHSFVVSTGIGSYALDGFRRDQVGALDFTPVFGSTFMTRQHIPAHDAQNTGQAHHNMCGLHLKESSIALGSVEPLMVWQQSAAAR